MQLPPKFLVLGGSGTGKTTATTTFLSIPWVTDVHVLSTQPQTTRVWSSIPDPRVHIHVLYQPESTLELNQLLKRVNTLKALPYDLIMKKPDEDKRKYEMLPKFLEVLTTIKSSSTTVIVVDMLTDIFTAVRDTLIGKEFTESYPLFYACQRLALDVVGILVRTVESSHLVCTCHTEPVKNSITQETVSFIGEKKDPALISNFSDCLFSYLDVDKAGQLKWLWTNYQPERCKVYRLGLLKAGIYAQDYNALYTKYGITS